MRCFYCKNLRKGELTESDFSKEESRHLFKVLRGKTGEKVLLIDGNGKLAQAEITEGKTLSVKDISSPPPPKVRIHLFIAPPKKNKIDQLLKQSSEIGIASISMLVTERGISVPSKDSSLERMMIHLIEGCKQAKNPFIPELCKPIPLLEAAKRSEKMTAYFGSTKGETSSLKNITEGNDIAWFVGPEGGFTDKEEELMKSAGIKPLSIGKWVMRIETAAITGSSILLNRNN